MRRRQLPLSDNRMFFSHICSMFIFKITISTIRSFRGSFRNIATVRYLALLKQCTLQENLQIPSDLTIQEHKLQLNTILLKQIYANSIGFPLQILWIWAPACRVVVDGINSRQQLHQHTSYHQPVHQSVIQSIIIGRRHCCYTIGVLLVERFVLKNVPALRKRTSYPENNNFPPDFWPKIWRDPGSSLLSRAAEFEVQLYNLAEVCV